MSARTLTQCLGSADSSSTYFVCAIGPEHNAPLRATVRTRALAPALAAVALLALASGALAASLATKPKGDVANGRVLFRRNCGTCHRLLAAATHGNVGPNLNWERVSYSEGVWLITNGLSTMPGFKDRLTKVQIRDLAAFLASSTDG
jgi:mono/diheme cytochrome c family protein